MASTGEPDKTAEEKAIDDWLPITSSRTAKWWYSTFHNVTAMVGAGVLSLPYAMASMGWYGTISLLALIIVFFFSIYETCETNI